MLKPSDLNSGDMQVIALMFPAGVRITANMINMSRKTEQDLQSSYRITKIAIDKAKKK